MECPGVPDGDKRAHSLLGLPEIGGRPPRSLHHLVRRPAQPGRELLRGVVGRAVGAALKPVVRVAVDLQLVCCLIARHGIPTNAKSGAECGARWCRWTTHGEFIPRLTTICTSSI